MGEADDLRAAIAALESHRQSLGNAVDTAIRPLRSRLSELEAASRSEAMKMVTVVFSDLVGFTAMSERMDPEEVRDRTGLYFRSWTESVESEGGVVEKFIGDAVLSVFGLPLAREDDAVRAVRAATTALGDLIAEGFHLRIGINSGEALVSALDERRGEFVVVGDVVNTASRLQAAAPVDGILLAENTWELVRRHYVAAPQPPLTVKGKREALQTFLIEGEKPKRFRLDHHAAPHPLVGRARELGELRAELDRLAGGGADLRTVVVVGDAGVGKSRLLAELDLVLERDSRPFTFLRARAESTHSQQPGAFLRELIGARFGIGLGDDLATARTRLSTEIGAVTPLNDGELAAVQQVLGFRGEPSSLDAEATWFLGTRALAAVLRTLADAAPLVVLLEDLHWADQASLDALDEVLGHLAGAPAIVVATSRPEFVESHPWPASGQRSMLRLEGLSASECAEIAARISGEHLDSPTLRKVVEAADGNPYFVEELTRMILERGGHDRALPPTLVGVLQARLDAIAPAERAVAQSASVIGRSFWTPPVATMVGAHVDDELASLARRGLVYAQDETTLPAAPEYSFNHGLFREVAYRSLLTSERRDKHRIAAQWLSDVSRSLDRSDDFASIIATHFADAGDFAVAAEWLERAGDVAARQFASQSAIDAYEGALRCRAEVTGPAGRDFSILLRLDRLHELRSDREGRSRVLDRLAAVASGLHDVDRAEALLRRSEHEHHYADYPAATAAGHEALALLDRAEDDDSRAGRVRAELQLQLGHVSWITSRLDEAEEHLHEAVTLAQRLDLDRAEATGWRLLGLVADGRADYRRAIGYFRRALEIAHATGDLRLEAQCHNSLGVGLMNAGDLADVEQHLTTAMELRDEIGDVRGASGSRHNLAVLWFERGDLSRARRQFVVLEAGCRELGDRDGEAAGLLGVAAASVMLGDESGAEPALAAAVTMLEELQDDAGLAEALVFQARFERERGDLSAARRCLDRATGIARRGGFNRDLAFALTEYGRLALLDGAPGEALALSQEADAAAGHDADISLAIAALAASALASSGDEDAALAAGTSLVARLRHDSLGGERMWAWVSAVSALDAAGAVEAAGAIAAANAELVSQAARLDPTDRASFLGRPDHRALTTRAARVRAP